MVKEKPAAAAPPGSSEDAAQLLKEVAAYASELGLGTGVGIADAFDDFAPHKAKQPLSTAAKVKLSESERKPVAETAAGGGKQSSQQARNVSPPAEVNQAPEREWNFGVGPRPGEQHGKSLLGKSDPTVWFEAAAALPPLPASDQPISDEDVERLRQQGEQMLANEAASFEREMQKRNAADYKWLQQVKRQGTTADKVAAITLQVQESAVANLAGLDMLLGWVTRRQGGREVVRQALEALQELFLAVLLPDGRRLKHLESQPLASLPSGKEGAKYLLWWFLEDQIKVRYGLFVGALEECSRDNLEFLKDKATKALYTLLVKKPEAEARLLGALVNKLGDPARKLASKAGYLLSQLLLQHPVMKPVVLRELERFVFRPGLQDRARYYAVVFMNQLPLNRKESEGGASLAGKLVGLYFTLFRMVVEGSIGLAAATRKLQEERYSKERATYLRAKQRQQQQQISQRSNSGTGTSAGMGMKDRERQRAVKPPKKPDLAVPEEMDARLLSALITGIRRAFPFVAPEEVEPLVEANCQRLFTLMHTAPFPVAVQALMLMWQLMSSKSAVTDRFYRALYSVMSNEAALTSSKAPMFLSLLFKAMRVDISTKRCAAFSKRLLQTAVLAPPAFACGSLLLVSEVLKAQPALWAGVLQPEDLAVPITTSDIATSLHTSHADHIHPTGNGLGTSQHPGQGNGKPGGRQSRQGGRAVPLPLLADDGEEVFRDVESSEEVEGLPQGPGSERGAGRQAVSLRVRRGKPLQASSGQEGQQSALQVATPQAGEGGQQGPGSSAEGWPRAGCYDMSKREPQFAGAERSCWWELAALAAHSHPSVAAMARTLLAGQCVVYDGDPLKDMALAAFLDKFIAKKPKAQARGASLMQPITAADPELHPQTELGSVGSARPSSAGPGSEAFAALAESQVQPDEVFFHRFYTLQTVKARRAAAKTAKAAKRAKQGKGSDDDASSDDGKELGSEDEAEADALLEKEEGGVDDKLGDPDVGYDYDQLVSIMAEDSSKGPGRGRRGG
ncbi:CBF/Mak21 family-domain-containing protein [Haematococcus lacustris]